MPKLITHLDLIIIAVFLILGGIFRLANFESRHHFLADQATSSLRAKEIFDHRELTTVGIPVTSLHWLQPYAQLYISSTSYYFQLIPLILGGFNPLHSNFVMACLGTLLIIPFYLGAKLLVNRRGAVFLTIVFALSPLYVYFSSFMWNPNTLLLLFSPFILFLGLYRAYRRPIFLGLACVILGLMGTLHFQFLFAVAAFALFSLFFLIKHKKSPHLLWLIGGLFVGVFPLVLNELIKDFYNFRVLGWLFAHRHEITGSGFVWHYLSNAILLGLIGLTYFFHRFLKNWLLILISSACVIYGLYVSFISPVVRNDFQIYRQFHGHQDNIKIAQIINSFGPQNFNVFNLAHGDDGTADVIKYYLYWLFPETYQNINPDYLANNTLFVIAFRDHQFIDEINYEINTFVPSSIEQFAINDQVVLYLWRR
ncbi:hypothetical protein FWH30_00460 [Microgenomates group bacterium]|nr:hypothetical protein [Microgenomates group bacterium]